MAPTYSNGQEMVSIYLIKIKITTKFFKLAGYVPHYEILTGNIFGLFEKQDGRHRCFFDFQQGLLWALRSKGYDRQRSQIRRICSPLQNLDWEYFWPHFEKQDGRHGRFFVSHEKCLYLPYYWSWRLGMSRQPIGNHGQGIF